MRFRKTVPDAWLRLEIDEGRNRQVRRMTAAVGLPTLRLVRVAVAGHALDGLAPGDWRVLDDAPGILNEVPRITVPRRRPGRIPAG